MEHLCTYNILLINFKHNKNIFMLLLTHTQDRFLAINQIEVHLFETRLQRKYIKFEASGNLYDKLENYFHNSLLLSNISWNITLLVFIVSHIFYQVYYKHFKDTCSLFLIMNCQSLEVFFLIQRNTARYQCKAETFFFHQQHGSFFIMC